MLEDLILKSKSQQSQRIPTHSHPSTHTHTHPANTHTLSSAIPKNPWYSLDYSYITPKWSLHHHKLSSFCEGISSPCMCVSCSLLWELCYTKNLPYSTMPSSQFNHSANKVSFRDSIWVVVLFLFFFNWGELYGDTNNFWLWMVWSWYFLM